nr:YSIRK-type signal peptide-containing protein [Streptococcus gallolyticus]
MDKKERFSFRKYKVGLVSVLVGAIFLAAGAGRVSADELSKAAGVSQIDPTSNIEQVVQATESSSTADFAQVASMEEATTEVSGVESTATASATAIIPYKFGIELAKGGYQIKFSDLAEKFDNLGAGKFSSFSSWGLTKDGALKLDVAAPRWQYLFIL